MGEPNELIRCITKFNVRNDKNRGLLIESLESEKGDTHFFQYRDQPIGRHCIQMQNIVKKSNVLRTKMIFVDLKSLIHEYYRRSDDSFQFKGTKLMCVSQQVQKAQQMMINKEIGAMKRKQTVADKKKAKITEENKIFMAKLERNEEIFQAERVRRIREYEEEQRRENQMENDNGTL